MTKLFHHLILLSVLYCPTVHPSLVFLRNITPHAVSQAQLAPFMWSLIQDLFPQQGRFSRAVLRPWLPMHKCILSVTQNWKLVLCFFFSTINITYLKGVNCKISISFVMPLYNTAVFILKTFKRQNMFFRAVKTMATFKKLMLSKP